MRHIGITVGIACAVCLLLAYWTWQRWLDAEVPVTSYASLYTLRRMDPAFFKENLLPGLEQAMQDGRLTRRELRAVEESVRGFGPKALKAYSSPLLGEQLAEALEEAQRQGSGAGKSFGESLGKTLDDISKFLQRKSDEWLTAPEPVEPPTTF